MGGIGCALAMLGELNTAARLLGAAEALHERIGEPIEPYAARAYADGSAPVRSGSEYPNSPQPGPPDGA